MSKASQSKRLVPGPRSTGDPGHGCAHPFAGAGRPLTFRRRSRRWQAKNRLRALQRSPTTVNLGVDTADAEIRVQKRRTGPRRTRPAAADYEATTARNFPVAVIAP